MGNKFRIISITILIFIFKCSIAQPHIITLKIGNQPNKPIILGSIKGDKFTPIDTTQVVNGVVEFQLSANNTTGVYRVILGQTLVAEVLNEPPQQLDFIYNSEDLTLKTDFNQPEDSLKVIQSSENEVWYDFIKKEKVLLDQLKMAEKELDYYRATGVGVSNSDNAVGNRITRYNQLQKQRDSLIIGFVKNYPGLYATKLIRRYREPFLDGKFDKHERDQMFKSKYFDQLDFTDESLMNSDGYTKKVFKYLMSYAQRGLTREQQEQEFKNAIDVILTHSNQNEKVYEFVLDYLVSGFEKLRLDNLITYLADKYSGTTCQTDAVSTLERKLLQQKMKVGTVIPDFELNDINGDPIQLSAVLKDKNLVVFWASWCPHCDELLPQILEWQKSAGSSDFEVISISLDEVEKDWKDKVFEMGIEGWYNLSSLKKWDCEVVMDYNVYATPTMFIIDTQRKIIAKPLSIQEIKTAFL